MKVKTRFAKAVSLLLVVALVMTSGVLSFAETDNAVPQEEAAAVETTQQPSAAPAVQEPQDNQTAVREETTATAPETQPTEAADSQTDVSKESTPSTDKADKAASESTEKKDAEKDKAKDTRARTLTATAADGARITVNAPEGAFDKDVKVRVSTVSAGSVRAAVKAQDRNVGDVAAYDITIVDKSGKEVQPAKAVSVKIAGASVDGSASAVYHVNDAKTSATPVSASTGGSSASFAANHFSIYVVVTEDDPAVATYEFKADGETVSTQNIKDGEKLIEPEAPELKGKTFIGWYTADGKKFEDFNKAIAVEKSASVTLTARYESALYVYFYNPGGTQIMKTEVVTDHEDHDFSSVSYDVDSTHKLMGWAAEKNGTTDISKKISVPEGKESVNVYAIIKTGNWVAFDSDGGSAISQQFVLEGEGIVLDGTTTPEKSGYTFDGWYDGTTEVGNGDMITKPVTLKAKWKAATVKYTVIHWQENADDSDWSYKESQSMSGITGDQTAAVAKSYQGFTAKKVTQQTIAGDGSTIVNVYYDRNVYTVTFWTVKWSGGLFGSYVKDKEITENRITAKHGANIRAKWPGGIWNTEPGGSVFQGNIDTMPVGGDEFFKTDQGSAKAYYYLADLSGNYVLDHTDTGASSNATVTKEDRYDITGFTCNISRSAKDGSRYNGAKFYYDRNSYDVVYVSNGEVVKTQGYKYQADISGAGAYTPQRPQSLPEYYAFDGWYADPEGEEAYTFADRKMPANNVTVYAKWTPHKVTLTYNVNEPVGEPTKGSEKIDAGTAASEVLPSPGTVPDYTFAGWYDADGKMFNPDNRIEKNTSVTGKWLYNGEFKVQYKDGDKVVKTDPETYADGSKAKVATGIIKLGNKFLGWKLGDKLYKPGDKFDVSVDIAGDDKVITLTAVWGDSEASTGITYDPGNGKGTADTVNLANNDKVTLPSAADMDFAAPDAAGDEEYYFAGWATSKAKAEAGNVDYQAGDKVIVDNLNEGENNTLYASWVKKKEITVEANSRTVTYNGEEQSVSGFKTLEIDGYTVSGITASASGTDVKAGGYETVTGGTVKVTKDGKDVTDRVKVKIIKGKLIIEKKALTFTGESASKVYNGATQEITGITEAGLLKGHDYSGLRYSAKGKDVGGYDGAFSGDVVIKDAKGSDVTKNYEVTKTPGKLTITAYTDEVIVTITEHSGKAKYDGTEKTVTGYDVKNISNKLYTEKDFEFSGNATIKGTDAGTYDMELKSGDFKNTNSNFSKVKFVIEDGQLEIGKRPVKLTSASASKEYDGTPLTKKDVTVSGDGFVKGEGATYDVTGTITNVGKVDNKFTYELDKNTKASNYEITKEEGTLEVTPVDAEVVVTITEHSGKAKYDGTEKTVTGYDVKSISNKLYTEKDFEFSGNATIKGTDAGTYDMELKPGDFKNTNRNFSKVKFVIEDGQLEIEKRTVKMTSASADKEYDGTPLTKKDVTETGDGFVKGEGATYDVTGTITNVGKVDNKFTYELDKNTKAGNYEITTEEGTLEVTPVDAEVVVTITEHSGKAKYDGTEKTVTGYDVKNISNKLYTKDDFEFSGNATIKGTDAGTYDMELKSGDFKNTNSNFSKVKFVIEDGQLEIGKRPVKLTSASASKEYDGTPLTKKDVTVSGDGFVKGEGAAYDVTGTITNVGKVDNKFTYTLNEGTKAKNYEITKEEGTLEVTPVDAEVVVTITEHSGKAKYDGTEKTVTGYDVKNISNKLYTKDDFEFSGNATIKGTDAGTYDMELKSGDFKNTNSNFSKVKFVIEDGQLEIGKRTVKLTSASANKEYDGTPLTKKDVTVSGDGFVKGEGATYDVTGTITNVGKVDNEFTYELDKNTKAGNYEITTEEGTLEVTPGKIADYVTLTPKDTEKVYDGTPLAAGEATAEDKNGGELKIEYSTDGENWTEDFASITAINVADTKTVQVRVSGTNYEGYAEGTETVTVTPAPLKVVTPNASKYYDGKPLTKEGTLTGLVNDETATLNTTGTQTKIGRSDNTYELIWDGTAIEGNYTIEEEIGVLEVRPESPGPDDPTKPEDPDKPGKHDSHKNVNKTDNVNESQTRTGDDSNMLLYGGTGLASVAAALIALFARRRKEENEE